MNELVALFNCKVKRVDENGKKRDYFSEGRAKRAAFWYCDEVRGDGARWNWRPLGDLRVRKGAVQKQSGPRSLIFEKSLGLIVEGTVRATVSRCLVAMRGLIRCGRWCLYRVRRSERRCGHQVMSLRCVARGRVRGPNHVFWWCIRG